MSDWRETVRFSVDWVNVRVDCPSVTEFLDAVCEECNLDPEKFEIMPGGLHFYGNGLRYTPAGYKAITFSYMLLEDGSVPVEPVGVMNQHGILCSISGDGCRFLDAQTPNGLRKFLNICRRWEHNCTRMDVAMDIFDRDNPIVPMFEEFGRVAYDPNPGHINIVSGMKRKEGWVRSISNYDEDEGRMTSNVYIGDPRSSYKGCCVCYNKKIEIRTGRLKRISGEIFDRVGCEDYWWRIEYRTKSAVLSNTAFEYACEGFAQDVFAYVAENMFWFVDQKYSIDHLAHCEMTEEWSSFMEWLGSSQNVHFV